MFVLLIYVFIWLILLPSLFPPLSLFLFLVRYIFTSAHQQVHPSNLYMANDCTANPAILMLVDLPRLSLQRCGPHYEKKNSPHQQRGYIEDHEVSYL